MMLDTLFDGIFALSATSIEESKIIWNCSNAVIYILSTDDISTIEKDFSRNNSASPLYEAIRVPAIRLPDKVFASKYDVQSQKEKNKKSDFLGDLEDENEE